MLLLLLLNHSIVFDYLRSYGLQHAREVKDSKDGIGLGQSMILRRCLKNACTYGRCFKKMLQNKGPRPIKATVRHLHFLSFCALVAWKDLTLKEHRTGRGCPYLPGDVVWV